MARWHGECLGWMIVIMIDDLTYIKSVINSPLTNMPLWYGEYLKQDVAMLVQHFTPTHRHSLSLIFGGCCEREKETWIKSFISLFEVV